MMIISTKKFKRKVVRTESLYHINTLSTIGKNPV